VKLLNWFKDKFKHKLEHLKWSNVKKTFREHGLALVVIVVGWEIIEDIIFPAIFALLGNYVHPVFFTGIPVAWIICLHWLMVPLLWGMWVRYKGIENNVEHECGGCDESR
jgi:hypothetical protein